MKLFKFITALACSIILFSCSKDDLPQYNEINSLRVIAMTTPTPEVNPADPVVITPVISDINSMSLTDSAQVCVDLGVSFGLTPTCEGNSTKFVIHSNRAAGLASNSAGSATSFNFIIPNATIMFAGRSAAEQFNGVNYLVEYILKNPAGSEVRSFRRIIVSTKVTKNTNPIITDVFSNGLTMTTLPVGSRVNLSSDLSLISSENYQIQDSNSAVTATNELLSVTWMITDGKTKFFRSDVGQTNEYTGPNAAPIGRFAYVFAVARDNRGGVTVIKKQF